MSADVGYQSEGTFAVERLARKDHRCDSCGGKIPAGTRYKRWTASPKSDHTAGGWAALKVHRRGECLNGY